MSGDPSDSRRDAAPAVDRSAPTDTESSAIDGLRAVHLVVFHQDGARSHRLVEGRTVTIGRAVECDVQVDAVALSRKHFCVTEGSPPIVCDLGSANGTKVNGRRIAHGERTEVELGALIEAGGVFFMLKERDPLFKPPPPPDSGAPRSNAPRVVVAEDAMTRLHALVDLVARSDISVLVVGETGVGKEVISAAVHRRSPRADKPYVRLNCAALPETLLESEIFGYEKGAFTGAAQAKQGLIELAHEGTLFLDEIGEMPLATQAKLLRVLENGELLRIGALRPKQVDVRFIAATNADVPALVASGAFRRDLFFRLNGITVPIPPLRERIAEIAPLARLFLEQAATRLGRSVPTLPKELLDLLVRHSWPGNVRELKNVMDRAVTLCTGARLQPEHVILDRVEGADAKAGPTSRPPGGRLMRMDADTERRLIMQALEQAGGNQSRAAEILGVSRRTLVNRLGEYGIRRPRHS
jgi:transcriptional regulator with GAF, ATPase, and Fis domain